MLEPGREPRASTLLMSINPKKPTKRGYYLALTFGTLLSSQGADAHDTRPAGLRSRRYLDCTPCSAAVEPRGFVRRLTRLAARPVLARCRENGTPPAEPLAGGPRRGLSSIQGPGTRTSAVLPTRPPGRSSGTPGRPRRAARGGAARAP